MADGTSKAIKDIEVGDEVIATNPATGETSAQQVTLRHENLDQELTDITVGSRPASGNDGDVGSGDGKGDRSTNRPSEVLHTTAHHPFWDESVNAWVNAADLIPGKSRLTSSDGKIQYVVDVRNFVGEKRMNDLTVANVHTYYVVVGGTSVLVHNNDGGIDVLFGQRRIGPYFSEDGAFKGRSIYAVAEDLKSGRLSPDGVRVNAFWHNGVLVAENNRSLAALSLADMRPTNVNILTDVPSSLRKRLNEGGLVSDVLPSNTTAVTPTQRDLRVADIISTAGGC